MIYTKKKKIKHIVYKIMNYSYSMTIIFSISTNHIKQL